MDKKKTNHPNNYIIRLYTKAGYNSGDYQIVINAKNKTQALYLAIKRFYRSNPNIEITRARIYNIIKKHNPKIVIDI